MIAKFGGHELVELDTESDRKGQEESEGDSLSALLDVDEAGPRDLDEPSESGLGELFFRSEFLESLAERGVQLLVVGHGDSLRVRANSGQSEPYPV